MKVILFLIALSLFAVTNVIGSGYQVVLQGNRSTGMGNLGVALTNDASTLFFNPGAVTMMDHNSVMIGINPIMSNTVFWNSTTEYSNYTASTDNPMGTPFHFFVVWGPKESRWKFGLSAVTPFGSGVSWGDEWMGRDLLTEIDLADIQIQATASFKITDNLGIGAGFITSLGSVSLSKTIMVDGEDGNGSVSLEGKANTAFGYNIGLFWSPSAKFDIGLNYRSKITMQLENGDASFTVPSSLAPVIPAENSFSASLPLPAVASAGVTWHTTDKLDIGFEFDWVGWSAYKSLAFDFTNNTPAVEDTDSPRNYKDSWNVHLGGEYRLEKLWQFRAGVYYDKTPVQVGYMTPETPDSNRLGLTAGVGLSIGKHVQLDLSFLYVDGMERQQTEQDAINAGTLNPEEGTRDVLPGTYRLNAFIPGLSFAYKF